MPQRKSGHSSKHKQGESPTSLKKPNICKLGENRTDVSIETQKDQDQCDNFDSGDLPARNESIKEQDDDEEAWLDALEKGDLDDFGELKKEKDPSLLTARQKALKERTSVPVKPAANLPKIEVLSEEAQKKKAEKNKRRKLQAVRKAEESQKQTIERLVKQQGVRGTKDRQRKAAGINEATDTKPTETKNTPMIKFHSKGHTLSLSYPKNFDCPIKQSTPALLEPRPKCVICSKPKRYNCSSTNLPVCSLECYKENLKIQLMEVSSDPGETISP